MLTSVLCCYTAASLNKTSKVGMTMTPRFGTRFRAVRDHTNVARFMTKGFRALCLLVVLAAPSFCSAQEAPRPTAASDAIGSVNWQIGLREHLISAYPIWMPKDVAERLLRFSNGTRIGYMDRTGKIVIPPVFDGAVPSFFRGKTSVRKDGKWGVIDHTGAVVIAPTFDELDAVWASTMKAAKDKLWGVIDGSGKWIIDPQYSRIRGSASTGYVVTTGGRTGMIDGRGKTLFAPLFDDVEPTAGLMVPVRVGKLWGFADRAGKLVIAPRFSDLRKVDSHGVFVVLEDGKRGLINQHGVLVIPSRYQDIRPTLSPHIWIVIDEQDNYGLVDTEGNVIVPNTSVRIENLGEAGLLFKSDGLYAIADTDGRLRTDYAFEAIAPYVTAGLAAAKAAHRWGFIDASGRFVIPNAFEKVGAFSLGLAPASRDGRYGYIDQSGRDVIPNRFDEAYNFFPDRVATVRLDGRYVYVDRAGKVIAALHQPDVPSVDRLP